jgi:hypothetical protein
MATFTLAALLVLTACAAWNHGPFGYRSNSIETRHDEHPSSFTQQQQDGMRVQNKEVHERQHVLLDAK